MKKFNHLNIPQHWEQYWSKYPNGYSILEALIDWVSQVDDMVDDYNTLTDHVTQFKEDVNNTTDGFRSELDTFLNQFDSNLSSKVIDTLSDWQSSGFLDVVIDSALETKYHEMDDRLTAQLEHIENEENEDVIKAKKVRPMMSIVDDDAHSLVWERLKPISEAKGVPFTLAVISDDVGKSNKLSKEQLLHLQNELGWEIGSHYKTHLYYEPGVTTEEELVFEMSESKRVLQAMGLNVSTVAYPGGFNDRMVRRVAKRFYTAGLRAQNIADVNTQPLNNTGLWRVGLDQYNDIPTEENPVTNTIGYYKKMIDKAIDNNGWVIFMSHCYTEGFSASDIEGIIEYAQLKGVDITTIKDGLKVHGNIFEANEIDTSYQNPFTIVTAEGHLYTNTDYGLKDVHISRNATTYNPSASLSTFGNKVTLTAVGSSHATDAPDGKSGVLTTYNPTPAFPQFAYQEYNTVDGQKYKRNWDHGVNAWKAWVKNLQGTSRLLSFSFDFDVLPGRVRSQNFGFSGARTENVCVVNPLETLPSGVIMQSQTVNEGVRLIFHNTTDEEKTIPTGTEFSAFIIT